MKTFLMCVLTITCGVMAASAPSDVHVSPMLTTTWGQTTVGGNACFNYYTPGSSYPTATYGSTSNYPSGCVATAMAQVVNYHQWAVPFAPGTTFNIEVDGTPYSGISLMGGTLAPNNDYDWALMQNISTDPLARQETGRLLHDLGIALSMNYYSWASWGSGTDFENLDGAFSAFSYSNAKTLEGNDITGGTLVANSISPVLAELAITTNLDAELPVIIGINDNALASGHALVIDGYGYDTSGTAWFHWNFGLPVQGVTSPATNLGWFTLPGVGTTNDSAGYTVLDGIAMNTFRTFPPSTFPSGEIISGRITNITGSPVSGIQVDITGGAAPITVFTNANGIYAAYGTITSNTAYLVTATGSGYTMQSLPVTTGLTQKQWIITNNPTTGDGYYINTVGNRRVDFVMQPGICDMAEFAGFSQYWNSSHTQATDAASRYDYNADWSVNFMDLQRIAAAWLMTPVEFRTELSAFFGATGPLPSDMPWQGTGWTIVTAPGGMAMAQSPTITHSQSTSLKLPVKLYPGLSGNVNIMFDLECDTETNFDVFEFLIDGVVQTEMGGFSAFSGLISPAQPMSYQLTGITAPTLKTLEWRYTKDAANSIGADTVWIGNIMVTASP